jgi:serine/threonine protein kinase
MAIRVRQSTQVRSYSAMASSAYAGDWASRSGLNASFNRGGGLVTQVDEGPDSPGVPGMLTYGAPRTGEVLAERYELQEHINDDAFGRQVWRGIDVILRRPVAVVLRYPGGEAAVEMLDAAVAASRVVHPHLVDVYDAIDEGSRAYVVREWVDGSSLREMVAEAPLEPERATSVASAVASAVAAVHATGMAHGNVHPGTVLVGSDGRVVLADARADEAASPNADVRAIGGVLYCALTGLWPQAEAGTTALPDAIRDPSGALASPRQVRGGVPGHLSDLATDVLDPSLAPPSADVLSAELNRLDSEQRDSEFFTDGGPLDFNQTRYADPATPEVHRPIGRKLAVGIAALVVLALVGLLVGTRLFSNSNDGDTPLQPSGGGGTSASSGPATPAAAGHPTDVPIAANHIRIVENKGDRDSELDHPEAMVDSDPQSAWQTEHYDGDPKFGRLKDGIGIWLDLGSPKKVSTVQISFTQPGATVELRTGTTNYPSSKSGDAQTVSNYKIVGSPTTPNGSTVVLNGDGSSVQYLMVWISKLPVSEDDPNRYQVGIQDIKVEAG